MPDGHPCESQIDTRTKLGRGATATIYNLTFGGESWAAKIYHQDRGLNSEKILAMLANTPSNTKITVDGRNYPQFAWPAAQLKDRYGAQVGYLMPLVDVNDSYTLDHYYDQGLFKKLNRPEEAALSYKLEIAQNLSALVAELHKHQHHFIDFKPQNIRVFRRTHVVTLLDCDGFSIFGNSRRYPAELLSTDYIAPEAQRRNSSPADLAEPQDRYALAVILFQLLNRGTHPFQGIVTVADVTVSTNDEKAAAGLYPHGLVSNTRIKPRPQSTHHLWPDETRALFDQAFTTGSPSARPSAEDWANHFQLLLSTKTLVRCERFPNELEHIRFKGKGCPTCYLSGLPTFQPQTKHKISEESLLTSQATPPAPSGSNTGWWVVGGTITLFLIVVFNANDVKKSTHDTDPTQPRPSSAPSIQPPSPSLYLAPIKEAGFLSVYVSNGRAAGYATGHPSQKSADRGAREACIRVARENTDKETCKKLIGGRALCVAIAQSGDGALGAAGGKTKKYAEITALNICRSSGGDSCQVPERGSNCE